MCLKKQTHADTHTRAHICECPRSYCIIRWTALLLGFCVSSSGRESWRHAHWNQCTSGPYRKDTLHMRRLASEKAAHGLAVWGRSWPGHAQSRATPISQRMHVTHILRDNHSNTKRAHQVPSQADTVALDRQMTLRWHLRLGCPDLGADSAQISLYMIRFLRLVAWPACVRYFHIKARGKAVQQCSPFAADSDWDETPKAPMFLSKWEGAFFWAGLCVKGQTRVFSQLPRERASGFLTDHSPTSQRAAVSQVLMQNTTAATPLEEQVSEHGKNMWPSPLLGEFLFATSAFAAKKLLCSTLLHAPPLWGIILQGQL